MRRAYWVWVLAACGLAGCGVKPAVPPAGTSAVRVAPAYYDFGDGQPNPVEDGLTAGQAALPKKTADSCEQRLEDARLSAMLRRTVVRLSRRVPGIQGPRGQDSGSGVLIAPSGQILTAAHVARHGWQWRVEWAGGRTAVAEVREVDEGLDIARLEIRAPAGARFPYLRVARQEYYLRENVQGRGVLAAGFSLEKGKFALATTCARLTQLAAMQDLKGLDGLEGKLSQKAAVHVFAGDTPLGFSGGPVVDLDGIVVSLSCFRTRVSRPGAETVFVGTRPADFLEKIGLR